MDFSRPHIAHILFKIIALTYFEYPVLFYRFAMSYYHTLEYTSPRHYHKKGKV